MRRKHWMAGGLAAAAMIGTFLACSSDNGTGGSTKIDLSGTYSLVKLLLGGFLNAPGSTGMLTATTDSLHANIMIISPHTSIVHDTTAVLPRSYLAKQVAG